MQKCDNSKPLRDSEVYGRLYGFYTVRLDLSRELYTTVYAVDSIWNTLMTPLFYVFRFLYNLSWDIGSFFIPQMAEEVPMFPVKISRKKYGDKLKKYVGDEAA